MSVRFVIGRAGTGKTHHCIRAIRERLRENPLHGPRLLFLVPEQASQQVERAIHVPTDPKEPLIAASHRVEVLSFQRLGDRLLESGGAAGLQTLPESARVMVLRHLAARLAPQLRYYQRVRAHSGFLERMSGTIVELIQEGVSPGALATFADTAQSQLTREAAKIHDLHLLYSAYLDFLDQRLLDPSQNLRLARAFMDRCDWISGAEVWVDGFASLSGEETETLIELVSRARHADIAVLLDPACDRATAGRPRSIFSRTARTYAALNQLLADRGLRIEAPLILEADPPHRFRGNSELARVEKELFGSPPATEGPAPKEPTPIHLALVELPTRRLEVEHAVAQICRWTRGKEARYRYREIAIIVRDLEPYYDLIRSRLDDCAIACFIDRRRAISHHPVAELIRSASKLAVEGMTLDLVRILLKTELISLDPDASDELENFLIAHGIQGRSVWSGPDWQFRRIESSSQKKEEDQNRNAAAIQRINAARETVLAALTPWLDFSGAASGHPGRVWARQLGSWLDAIGVPATLSRWCDQARKDGDLDQAGEHEQVWAEILRFLEALTIAFGDRALSPNEFAEIIDAGLSSLTLGLVPPTVDQVLVGSIERTRHPDVKAAILMGFNDRVFPARHEEDSILDDDDRERMLAAGLTLGLTSRQRRRDESMLAYIALTRASRECIVTYARADESGAALKPSPYVTDLLAACPGLTVTTVGDPASNRSMWNLQTRADLRTAMTGEFRTRPGRLRDDPVRRADWNRLYDQFRAELAGDPVARMAFSSLLPHKPISLSEETCQKLFPKVFKTSVSALETFATCPFKFFAEKVLRLTERAESPLAAVDVGRVHHTILEEFSRIVIERKAGLGSIDAEELMAALRESCGRAADRLKTREACSTARDTYLLRRSASRLARILRAQQRQSVNRPQQIGAAELPFGFDDEPKGLPALRILTNSEREVLLRGYIDRVDLVELTDEYLGLVMDYKDTREKRLEFSQAYHGLSLQLIAYLIVLAEHGQTLAGRPVRAAGALYQSLGSQYQSVAHPNQPPDRESAQQGTFRPRGLLCADLLNSLQIEIGDNGWATHYSIFRKQNGELGREDQNDAVPGQSFDRLLAHTRKRMGELAERLLTGDVAVRPYRLGTFSPCSWCRLQAACRFESGLCEVNDLETLKRTEVYERLKNPEGRKNAT